MKHQSEFCTTRPTAPVKGLRHPAQLPVIAAIFGLAILAGCASGPVKVPFKYEEGLVRASVGGKAVAISHDQFPVVIDWSDNYGRSNCGSGILENGWFLFKGAINHSRDIVFAYNTFDRSVLAFPNVSKATCSASGTWALVQMQPLYTSESDLISIVVNGTELMNLGEAHLSDLHWSGGKLVVVLKP